MSCYFYLAIFLFSLGIIGLLSDRETFQKLIHVHLLFLSSSLLFILYSRYHGGGVGVAQAMLIIIFATFQLGFGLVLMARVESSQTKEGDK